MAKRFKTFKVPSDPILISAFEDQIEKEIISMEDEKYLLDKMSGDGSMIILVFKEKE